MSVNELESAVTRLPRKELKAFAEWFEDYLAEAWDNQIEADARAGKLDRLAKKADRDFESGRCTRL